MADILTQLQTCLDQLATQFYATVAYLTTYHDNSPAIPPSPSATTIPDNPDAIAPVLAKIQKNSTAPPVPIASSSSASLLPQQFLQEQTQARQTQQQKQDSQTPAPAVDTSTEVDSNLPPPPDSPRTFASRQRELARDLVIKEQQLEYLISVLPGIDSSEVQQTEKIQELEAELRIAEKQRADKVEELRESKNRLEKVLSVAEWGLLGGKF